MNGHRTRLVFVDEVLDAPAGTTRAGDEFHEPANWVRCPECGLESPADYDACYDCGADLPGARA